jgi:hypothetical protein
MIKDFEPITHGLLILLKEWEPKLVAIPVDVLTKRQNSQGRTIKQILGHMIDSASNNTHRIVHLQYQESPLTFPNYATNGNNDRWIAIQNYQNENWENIVQLWRYVHLHLIHVIENVEPQKLENKWNSESKYGLISLKEMVTDFLRHFKLHLGEIKDLADNG